MQKFVYSQPIIISVSTKIWNVWLKTHKMQKFVYSQPIIISVSTKIWNDLKPPKNHPQPPQKHLQPLANNLKPSNARHKCIK